jgi:hypothetical protein
VAAALAITGAFLWLFIDPTIPLVTIAEDSKPQTR